ncbi:hypothetical protein ZWY2020_045611 [Hordeum vulgare]|nr:hypothetical protein ZWY2020_045611 [Hordeum vulgare]
MGRGPAGAKAVASRRGHHCGVADGRSPDGRCQQGARAARWCRRAGATWVMWVRARARTGPGWRAEARRGAEATTGWRGVVELPANDNSEAIHDEEGVRGRGDVGGGSQRPRVRRRWVGGGGQSAAGKGGFASNGGEEGSSGPPVLAEGRGSVGAAWGSEEVLAGGGGRRRRGGSRRTRDPAGAGWA